MLGAEAVRRVNGPDVIHGPAASLYVVRKARASDAEGIARVYIVTARAQYAGLVSPLTLARLTLPSMVRRWIRLLTDRKWVKFAFVAEDAGAGVVGFVAGGPQRQPASRTVGECYALYVLPDHQGRGIGRQLLHRARHGLREQGMTTMIACVLARNPATAFFEVCGGRRVTGASRAGTIAKVTYEWREGGSHTS